MSKRALKAKRSAAARKGWETRRAQAKGEFIWAYSPAAKEINRLPFRFRDPGRPMLAADLGIGPKWWEAVINEATVAAGGAVPSLWWNGRYLPVGPAIVARRQFNEPLCLQQAVCAVDPNPWPRLAAMVRGWWQRAIGWWR